MCENNETNCQITNTTPETNHLSQREMEIAHKCADVNPVLARTATRLFATALAVSRTNMKWKKYISSIFILPYIMPQWTLANIWRNLFIRDLSQEENMDIARDIALITGMVMPDDVSNEEAERIGMTSDDLDALMEEFTQSERAMENSAMIISGLAYQFTKLLGALIDADDDNQRMTFAHVMNDRELMDRFIDDSIPTIAQALLLERRGVEWRGFGPSVMEGCVRKLILAKTMADMEMKDMEKEAE